MDVSNEQLFVQQSYIAGQSRVWGDRQKGISIREG